MNWKSDDKTYFSHQKWWTCIFWYIVVAVAFKVSKTNIPQFCCNVCSEHIQNRSRIILSWKRWIAMMIAASLIMDMMFHAAHITEWCCQNYSNQSEINCSPKWVGFHWHQNMWRPMMSTKPVLLVSNSIKFLDKNVSWFYFLRLMVFHKQFADAVAIYTSLSHTIMKLPNTQHAPKAQMTTSKHSRLDILFTYAIPQFLPLIHSILVNPNHLPSSQSPIGIPNLTQCTQFLFTVDNVNVKH